MAESRDQKHQGHFLRKRETPPFIWGTKRNVFIVERKRAEETLRESEERYRTIFVASPDYIYLTDTEGHILDANPALLERVGLSLEQIRQKHFVDFFAGDNLEELLQAFAKLSSGQEVKGLEVRARTSRGEVFEYEVNAIPLKEHGVVTRVWSLARDITERKRAEEQLRGSREQLRHLAARLQSVREEERMRVAREMHDELGQALTALKIDLTWLANRLPKNQKALLEKTSSMVELVDATIQSIRRIATELRPGVLDDLGLVAAIEWQTQEFQTHTDIRCQFTSTPEEIHVDQERATAVFRIFQEALTNVARHATATVVEVCLEEKAGTFRLEVRDNGRGITHSEVSSATSLGLLGMRERTLMLGGKVSIRGTPGHGTTVTVRIPLSSLEEAGKRG